MSTVLTFLEGYNPNMVKAVKTRGNINNVEGDYKLYIKKNNKVISELGFELTKNTLNYNLELKIPSGYTNINYRGQGYGTLLRALATKAGHIAGAKRGTHYGVNAGNRSVQRLQTDPTAKPVPTSTWVLTERLGWKPLNNAGMTKSLKVKSIESQFNYKNKISIEKVNRYLEKIRVRSPGCTRCSIQ
jgi:hypothetical protein